MQLPYCNIAFKSALPSDFLASRCSEPTASRFSASETVPRSWSGADLAVTVVMSEES